MGPPLCQPGEPIKPHLLLNSCEPLLSFSRLKRMENPCLPLGSRRDWRLSPRGRFLCQLSPQDPNTHTYTRTHTASLHLKLGLGTEDGEGEPGDSGDLEIPHCLQK